MKPAFTPRPVIYRGIRRKTAAGCCPACGRPISVNPSGIRRSHRDTHGALCPGSGVRVTDAATHPYDIDAAHAALAAVEQQIAEERAARAAEPTQLRPATKRSPSPRSGRCPECGQNPRLNKDGTLRAHRAEPDTFTGPYCPGGRPKGARA